MFDLKVINSVLEQMEEERGIPRAKMLDAIENALATAYKKEYGKRDQVVRAQFDLASGKTEFFQIKKVVDKDTVRMEDLPEEDLPAGGHQYGSPDFEGEEEERPRYNPERHIMIEDARRMKASVAVGEELIFPLESKSDFGRIVAQTAKQMIIQKIREAERGALMEEFGELQGQIVAGSVQRMERGNIYIDFGRTVGVLPYDEQIPNERFRQGERISAYLYTVEESARGTFLRLSRRHPRFVVKLFEREAPELASGTVEVRAIAREAGFRTKLAVASTDPHIDPVGSLVGQRGMRVNTVMSELSGEKIDIIPWSEDAQEFLRDALAPAEALSIALDEAEHRAIVEVAPDQQSLAIGRGGMNVRLAHKLTGWKIDIRSNEVAPPASAMTSAEATGDESPSVTESFAPDTVEAAEESVAETNDVPDAADAEGATNDDATPSAAVEENLANDSEEIGQPTGEDDDAAEAQDKNM